MSKLTLVQGARVRLKRRLSIFNLGTLPQGVTGEVMFLHPERDAHSEDDDVIVAKIKLDTKVPALDEWDNELHVMGAGDVELNDFEVYWSPSEENRFTLDAIMDYKDAHRLLKRLGLSTNKVGSSPGHEYWVSQRDDEVLSADVIPMGSGMFCRVRIE